MNNPETDELLYDRASGCLAGVAVGDALGSLAEGLSRTEIAGRYGCLREMTAAGPAGLEAGTTSDDTAQTLALAESIVARGRLDAGDVASRLAAWYREDGQGIGRHTAAVLSRVADGEDFEQAALEAQAANPGSAGNGSLMRCAPVALLHFDDSALLIEDSRLSSRVTHPHADCQWACALVNLVIALLLDGAEPLPGIEKALATLAGQPDAAPQVLDRARLAVNGASDEPPSSGYVLDTLEASLWALAGSTSFEEALVRAVNLGGDADTVGAVTGALAGAAYGFSSIPDRWLVHIRNWWRLQELATAIVDLP